jgi:hypothetical protein
MKKVLAKKVHSSMDTLEIFSGCIVDCGCSCGGYSYSYDENPIEESWVESHVNPQA